MSVNVLKESKEIPKIKIGNPFLYGTNYLNNGMYYNIVSENAQGIILSIFLKGENNPVFEIDFPIEYKFGNNWTMFVYDIDWSKYDYAFRVKGEYNEAKGLYFDETQYLIDPYANKVNGLNIWGEKAELLKSEMVVDNTLMLPKPKINDLIIYELHLRGFTYIANVNNPGTYLGLAEKIDYLKDLGVNCVELLPIFEFNENENLRNNPFTNEKLKNYWGYSTLSYNALKSSYGCGNPIGEFKTLVNELHKNNIKIILDVVFNHTCELGRNGLTLSFKGIDAPTYYMEDEFGDFVNLTGCGNTFNCNYAPVKEFIINSLRKWVAEYNIDGFRFDLASVLLKDEKGNELFRSLADDISQDSLLADSILIAEPWDCTSYHLGDFNNKWLEWNDKYRDAVRSFLASGKNSVYNLKQAIEGFSDVLNDKSVNFITAHDGFTLMDLFSYKEKHNEANGENNNDGNNNNISVNCGVEGHSTEEKINFRRIKMMKVSFVLLLLSKSVPMITMGDEVSRTQKGNNNAYCQDNEISWFDWSLLKKNEDLFNFVKTLIDFRKKNMNLIKGKLTFHGVKLNNPDYGENSHTLAFTYENNNEVLYVGINMYDEDLAFDIPYENMKIIFNTDTNIVYKKKIIISKYSGVVLHKTLKT